MTNNNNLSKIELEATRIIRNYLGQNGEFPSVRQLMTELNYKSPRSAAVVLESLEEKGIVTRRKDGGFQFHDLKEGTSNSEQTIDIPVVGTVACGLPILAQENVDAFIPVSTKLAKPPYKYFFLRAKGDSMNVKNINDGDLALIKQQASANNGDLVVALIDDEATLKEFIKHGETVILKPHSTNSKHKPIIVTNDLQIQGVVVTTIPRI